MHGESLKLIISNLYSLQTGLLRFLSLVVQCQLSNESFQLIKENFVQFPKKVIVLKTSESLQRVERRPCMLVLASCTWLNI